MQSSSKSSQQHGEGVKFSEANNWSIPNQVDTWYLLINCPSAYLYFHTTNHQIFSISTNPPGLSKAILKHQVRGTSRINYTKSRSLLCYLYFLRKTTDFRAIFLLFMARVRSWPPGPPLVPGVIFIE